MTEKKRIVIIGAGPTGLGAAYRLGELEEEDFVVLEASDHAGGLASSFVDDKGFTWDVGGHVQFSHYKYFDRLMDLALGTDGWFHHQREAAAWMRGTFVPYPVQNNIRYLPKDVMLRCLNGLIDRVHRPPKNFQDWILNMFGEGLANEFMFPYNGKVWAYPTWKLSANWVGERVTPVDLKRVVENIVLEKNDVSWGPNNTFRFPKRGGTGAIWTAVGSLVGHEKIRFETEVVSIDTKKKIITMRNKSSHTLDEIQYDVLISTMPIDNLYKISHPNDYFDHHLFPLLNFSSTHVIGLGLQGQPAENISSKSWMYFPGYDCPFYRATVFSNYSPNHVPEPGRQWSLMTETSSSSEKLVGLKEELIENTIQGCLNTKLIESRDQIKSVWYRRFNHGYPTPTVNRDENLKMIIPTLEKRDIYSRGRFGGWKYEVGNQDHSLMQGVELIDRLIFGAAEITYPHPDIANLGTSR